MIVSSYVHGNIRLIRDISGDQWEYEHLVWGEGRVVASGGDSQVGHTYRLEFGVLGRVRKVNQVT